MKISSVTNTIKNNKTTTRKKLPPKGTAARAIMAAGLFSHMSEEELNKFKNDIFSSRKSSSS